LEFLFHIAAKKGIGSEAMEIAEGRLGVGQAARNFDFEPNMTSAGAAPWEP
jgi:hypothetical protein